MVQKPKFGELELRIIAGLLTIIVGMVGWFGVQTTKKLDANTAAMNEVKIALVTVTITTKQNTKTNDVQDAVLLDHEKRIDVLEIHKID